MTERTPGPWEVEDCGREDYLDGVQSQYTMRDSAGVTVAYFFEEDEADRAVKAVNNHDKLVEALGALIVLKDYKDENGKDEHYLNLQPTVWKVARALLKTLTD